MFPAPSGSLPVSLRDALEMRGLKPDDSHDLIDQ
jgi:hypothetical protein